MSRIGGTLQSVVLKLAERLGIEDLTTDTSGKARVPTDAHDLDRCVRAVNEAQDRLVLEYPRWRALRPVVTITMDEDGTGPLNIEGDESRYALPSGVRGGPMESWVWRSTSGSYGGLAADTHPSRVRSLLANSSLTGVPQMIAVDRVTQAAVTAGRGPTWQAQVYPRPDQAYVLTAKFKIDAVPIAEMDEVHIWGASFDSLLAEVAYAIVEKIALPDDLIKKAIRHDQDNGSTNLGTMNDPGVWNDEDADCVSNTQPVYYNGVLI